MFGIGGFELFLILLFGFLVFGPDKLPAMAKTLGRAIAKFRDAQEEMSDQLKKQSFIDKDSDEPLKNPLDVIEQAANDAKSGVKKARSKADSASEAISKAADKAADSSKAKGGVAGGSAASDDAQDREGNPKGADTTSTTSSTRSASFAERKAQYDKERAARKAKEAQEAARLEAEQKEAARAESEKRENPKADIKSKKIAEASDGDGYSKNEDASTSCSGSASSKGGDR